MNCSILLASLAAATLAQPQQRHFHCLGENAQGQRITVDGNLTVDPNVTSFKRFTIGTVAVEKLGAEKSVTVYPPAKIVAEFGEQAMDLELRGGASRVYLQTGRRGLAKISIRSDWLKTLDYESDCRFYGGSSPAVDALTR